MNYISHFYVKIELQFQSILTAVLRSDFPIPILHSKAMVNVWREYHTLC